MKKYLILVLLLSIISCKKKDDNSNVNPGNTPSVDTVSLLKGNEWKTVYEGRDVDSNGKWDTADIAIAMHHTTSFYVLSFKDNGYMTDSAFAGNPPHTFSGIDGYWQFIGQNKSQMLFSHDSMAHNYSIIKEITDSTLKLYVSPAYWWILEKYKR